MICSLALDALFKHFAVQLCGLSRGEDYVLGIVKDVVLQHKKIEKRSGEVTQPESAPKWSRTGFFNALDAFIEEGPPMSSLAKTNRELDIIIDAYLKMPVVSQDADPLGF